MVQCELQRDHRAQGRTAQMHPVSGVRPDAFQHVLHRTIECELERPVGVGGTEKLDGERVVLLGQAGALLIPNLRALAHPVQEHDRSGR